MKVKVIWIGKSKDKEFIALIEKYVKRLKHYTTIEIQVLKDVKTKSKNKEDIKQAESKELLSKISNSDYVVLLDERGKHLTSVQLANWIQHKQNISINQLVFIITGAFGAHADLKNRADFIFSLSHLTLTHDMARVFLLEQIYRGYTILRGEKYHNV